MATFSVRREYVRDAPVGRLLKKVKLQNRGILL